jgi:hypothetical protein
MRWLKLYMLGKYFIIVDDCRLFDWLVIRINSQLRQKQLKRELQINILDIFGFEKFQRNDYEQFLINYANEVDICRNLSIV